MEPFSKDPSWAWNDLDHSKAATLLAGHLPCAAHASLNPIGQGDFCAGPIFAKNPLGNPRGFLLIFGSRLLDKGERRKHSLEDISFTICLAIIAEIHCRQPDVLPERMLEEIGCVAYIIQVSAS